MSRRFVPVAFAVAGALAAVMATASFARGDTDRGRSRGVAPGQCVSSPLNRTRIVDSRTLYVDDYSGRAVLLHMSGECLNDRNEAIGVKFQGTNQICDPLDVDITDSVLRMPTPCLVDSVEALDKDQAKAYRNGG